MLLAPYVCFHIFSYVKVTEWPPIGKIAAHSAYEMFSWYKYLIVSLVFSHLCFWSGNIFLIAPFPDLCLLVPFNSVTFFNSVLRPFQDYFSSYETGQSDGRRKRENPEKNPPGTAASRRWLVSHKASAGLEPTPVTAVI